jgi:hypothetical protein
MGEPSQSIVDPAERLDAMNRISLTGNARSASNVRITPPT